MAVSIPNYDSRPERPCMGCGQRDKAYRDQVQLGDGNVAYYHADCHIAIADCETCKKILDALGTDESPKGLKNEALHKALHEEMGKPVDERAEIFTSTEAIPQATPSGAE